MFMSNNCYPLCAHPASRQPFILCVRNTWKVSDYALNYWKNVLRHRECDAERTTTHSCFCCYCYYYWGHMSIPSMLTVYCTHCEMKHFCVRRVNLVWLFNMPAERAFNQIHDARTLCMYGGCTTPKFDH